MKLIIYNGKASSTYSFQEIRREAARLAKERGWPRFDLAIEVRDHDRTRLVVSQRNADPWQSVAQVL